jgi:putative endonuclease
MRLLGNRGETLAIKYLKKRGYRILKRNYSAPTGEIDIIAEDEGTLVFVEVKTRTDTLFGTPEEAVNFRKRNRITSTALHYMSRLKKQKPARFDIIGVRIKVSSAFISRIISIRLRI